MSYTRLVNYEQIKIQCDSICDLAEEKANELDKMIEQLTTTSKSLYNDSVKTLEKELLLEKNNLLKQIVSCREAALKDSLKGTVSVYDEQYRQSQVVLEKSKKLHDQINELSSNKFIHFRELIDQLLIDKINENNTLLWNKAEGKIIYSDEYFKLIDTLDDNILKQYVNIAYVSDPTLQKDELLNKAKELMNESFEERAEKEKQRIIEELEKQRISAKTINKIKDIKTNNATNTLKNITEIANKEIIDEKVRKKSLSLIKKAIQERGFIVDKKNIKIDHEKNEVIMVALKPSGEKATFKVYLDGKFIYDFHGYEGQACQKDIQPFMKDLEEVYGMKVISTEDIWSNPDKISTMKYQEMNYNKNKG